MSRKYVCVPQIARSYVTNTSSVHANNQAHFVKSTALLSCDVDMNNDHKKQKASGSFNAICRRPFSNLFTCDNPGGG